MSVSTAGDPAAAAAEPILRAAAALLREHGPAFTMAQLERRTGLSRATLYRRVGGKRAVLEDLAARGEATGPIAGDVNTRVLDAVRQVVGERGVAGTTLEHIAQEAGVGVATVYRHFGGRQRLFDAFVRANADRTRTRALLASANGDLRSDLTTIAGSALALFGDNRDLMRVVLGGQRQGLELLSALKGSSDRTLHDLAALFARAADNGRLEPGHDPSRLALAFVGILLAFAVIGPELYGLEPDDPDGLAALAVALFLDGVGR